MANADFHVEITDNTDELKKHADEVIERALTEVGDTAVGYVVQLTPVQFGTLWQSIRREVQGNSVIIGSNVEYAPAVEFNEKARHAPGKQAHYLRDGINNNLEKFKQIFRDVLSEG